MALWRNAGPVHLFVGNLRRSQNEALPPTIAIEPRDAASRGARNVAAM
jgi:hypothetical protein